MMDERFGFIHTKLEIKTLILFALARLPAAVSQDQLARIVICDDGISYFEFAECLEDLVKTKHAESSGDAYTITDLGRRNGSIMEDDLPYSVRIKAEASAAETAKVLKRSALIKTGHSLERRGGCTVELYMSDGVGEVMNLRILAPTEEQAKIMEKNFDKNAEKLYIDIAEMLCKEEENDI